MPLNAETKVGRHRFSWRLQSILTYLDIAGSRDLRIGLLILQLLQLDGELQNDDLAESGFYIAVLSYNTRISLPAIPANVSEFRFKPAEIAPTISSQGRKPSPSSSQRSSMHNLSSSKDGEVVLHAIFEHS